MPFPNTQYEIWHTDELGAFWTLIGTISPSGLSGITNEYIAATTNAVGFYAVSGFTIDPITD